MVSGKRMESYFLRESYRFSAHGIVDAVIVRIKPREPDAIEVRLVQLKSGVGGLTGAEITRLKRAVAQLSTNWLLAAFDGQTLHLVPARGKRSAQLKSSNN
jgi:hypothetical protein